MSNPLIVRDKLEQRLERIYDLICQDSWGGWLGFYYEGEDFSIDEHREFFFMMIRRMLDEKRVVFTPPVQVWKDAEKTGQQVSVREGYSSEPFEIWDLSTDELIQYFREVLPTDFKDINDQRISHFWYDEKCPQIGWVDLETGKIFWP